MSPSTVASPIGGRLERLRGFLAVDPDNLSLLADAAGAAFDEGDAHAAAELIRRYEALAPLTGALANLKGLAALNAGDMAAARAAFEPLLAGAPEDPALRFNLAWCEAVEGDDAKALELLDAATVRSVPQAAVLGVHALHRLGRLDEALALGRERDADGGADARLLGALSAVAIDAEDAAQARSWAERARGNDEAEATLGMLALAEDHTSEARSHFAAALSARPDNARALLGQGLALVSEGRPGEGLGALDRAADLFKDHLGSWIAAGWAAFAASDMDGARRRFQHALDLDETFAESHGALAVLDALAGDVAKAQRGADVALRLDRASYAGALAKSLLLSAAGDERSAERIRNIALNAPVGPGGKTLAQALAALPRRR